MSLTPQIKFAAPHKLTWVAEALRQDSPPVAQHAAPGFFMNGTINCAAVSDEKARIDSIKVLSLEYLKETDPVEKANILKTLIEIVENKPLEMPTSHLRRAMVSMENFEPLFCYEA